MDYDHKCLADAPTTQAKYRSMMLGALVALALLLVLGLAAGINMWILSVIVVVAATGFAVMVWPPNRDEREATAWWNGLTKTEREKWLTQGRTEMPLDAWEAYKQSNHSDS